MFSNIVWANRADADNNFANSFGVNAGQAMAVVDAVIEQYERVIADFNWTDATRFDLNVSMRNQPTNRFGGQCPPDEVGVDASGAPRSANVYIGSGADVNNDGLGDGSGYFLDPTPDDFSEFSTIVGPFVGDAAAGSPALGLRDFYTIVAHEVGHAVGMTSAAGGRWNSTIGAFATNTNVGDSSGTNGNLWAYQSNRVGRFVLTNTDLGQGGGLPTHSAIASNSSFQWNNQTYTPVNDVMNNTFSGQTGRRRLVSNSQAGMLADIYGYEFAWPEQFGSMYTSLDEATGTLTLRGGAGTSADAFSVLAVPDGYQVSVDVGTDFAGTGPTDAFVSTWSDAEVSSIVIQAGGGGDDIEIRTLGSNEPVSIDCGSGDDEVRLSIGDFDTNLLSDVSIIGGSGYDRVRVNDIADNPGADAYTLTATSFGKPGRVVALNGVDYLYLDGSQHNDTYNLNSFDGDLTINGHGGFDTFNVAETSGDLDGLPGLVRLIGDAGGDTLNLYDHNDTGADNYLFDLYTIDDPLNFTKPGASAGAFTGLYYAGIETILLEANTAGNTITARDVNAASLTVRGDGGSDRLVIDDSDDAGDDVHTFDRTLFDSTYRSSDDPTVITYRGIEDVTLEASNASNTVNVNGLAADLLINGHLGTDTAVIGGGDINSNVLGSVHFQAFLGGRVVFLDSGNPSVSNHYTLDGDEFTAGGPTHTFANVTSVTVECSDAGDTVDVEDTFGYELVVYCNGGTDLVNFGGGSLATMDNATVWGGEGGDELRLDDSTTFAPTTYSVNQTGGLPFVELFNGNTVVLYDSISDLRINAGPFADTITSAAVPTSTSLHIDGNGGDDAIAVQGHPTVNSALFPPAVVDGGAGSDTVEINTDGQGGARAEFSQSQDLRRLAIGESGGLRLHEGGLVVDVLNSATMPSGGFELDLADGFFVRRGNGSLPYYTSRVAAGYSGGAWDGLGINSSTAAATPHRDGLGIARAGDLFNGNGGTIAGISFEPDDILIRYTLSGDANLDGRVNRRDLIRLVANYNDRGTVWSRGDFNYDGLTNVVDFILLRLNYNQDVSNVGPQRAAAPAV